nr:hypothetical protein [Tanacetum cinerariifolium]
ATTKVKNINGEAQIHAKVDGKKVGIFEASIRRDLQFGDEGGVDCLRNEENQEKGHLSTVDEAVNEEMDNSLVRATTTDSSLEVEQDCGNIDKTQTKVTSNEPSSQETSLGDGPRCQDTMGDTSAHTRRVKNLEKKQRSRTHKLKRLYKVSLTAMVISFSDDKALDKEDTSKQWRIIDDLDVNEDIILVNDQEMFNADKDLQGVEVVIEQEVVADIEPIVDVVQDMGKAKITEEHVKWKKKDEILFDEEVARNLQEKINKEERLVGTDYQLAERLQAEEQQELKEKEKAKLFTKLLEKRRKFFAAKRTREKRNKPPTKAQQRSLMCTYLKNHQLNHQLKPKALKNKSFAEIQELFGKAMKRINTFVDFRT